MTEQWPAWAVERVEIVAADPDWPAAAARLVERLHLVLAPWLSAGIEHVGSTAVPGLAAKPVLDLLAPVTSLTAAERAAPTLARDGPWSGDAPAEGWSFVPPELDQRPWRRMFVLPEGDRRVAHLHLVLADDPHVDEIIAFRDALRRSADLRDAYARLKRSAAAAHESDREAYTAAKSAFVADVLSRARPG